MGFTDNLKNLLNVFDSRRNKSLPGNSYGDIGFGSRPDTWHLRYSSSSNSILGSIYNRIAIDAASCKIEHVIVDEDESIVKKIHDNTEYCLKHSANIDQTAVDFMHDLVYSMLDEGVIAVIPIDHEYTDELKLDIHTMRLGRITQWLPRHITAEVYNERTGCTEELTVPKDFAAIIQSPLNAITGGSNSALSRLKTKLALLDTQDINANGQLDVIIQYPFGVDDKRRTEQAKKDIASLEAQLKNSQYGIGYIGASEHITQLNRPAQNLLVEQVQSLTKQVYAQLGLTENIFNGTASEAEKLNYFTSSIDPILDVIDSSFMSSWIRKSDIMKGERFIYSRNPFKIVPIEQLAVVADTFTRNAIMTPNEVRRIVNMPPVDDGDADKLFNRNIADSNQDSSKSEKNDNVEQIQNEKKETTNGNTKQSKA